MCTRLTLRHNPKNKQIFQSLSFHLLIFQHSHSPSLSQTSLLFSLALIYTGSHPLPPTQLENSRHMATKDGMFGKGPKRASQSIMHACMPRRCVFLNISISNFELH